MRNHTTKGSRTARILVWLCASLLFAGIVGMGAVVWLLDGMEERSADARREALGYVRESAANAGRELLRAARSVELSRSKIRNTLIENQATLLRVLPEPNRLEVIAEVYGVTTADAGSVAVIRCYRFVVADPASPKAMLSARELPRCPPRTAFSWGDETYVRPDSARKSSETT